MQEIPREFRRSPATHRRPRPGTSGTSTVSHEHNSGKEVWRVSNQSLCDSRCLYPPANPCTQCTQGNPPTGWFHGTAVLNTHHLYLHRTSAGLMLPHPGLVAGLLSPTGVGSTRIAHQDHPDLRSSFPRAELSAFTRACSVDSRGGCGSISVLTQSWFTSGAQRTCMPQTVSGESGCNDLRAQILASVPRAAVFVIGSESCPC